jgi:hypothetical protein
MAITRGNVTSWERSNVLNNNVPCPTGLANGDIVLVVATHDQEDPTPPAGFTQIVSHNYSGANRRITAFVKRITDAASEPATYTFSITTAARSSWIAIGFSGVDTTVEDVAEVGQIGSGTTAWTSPSLTTVTPDAVLLSIIGANATASGQDLTPPADITEILEASGTGRELAVGEKVITTPGATGAKTWTSPINGAYGGVSMALRPAPVAAPTAYRRSGGAWVASDMRRRTAAGAWT